MQVDPAFFMKVLKNAKPEEVVEMMQISQRLSQIVAGITARTSQWGTVAEIPSDTKFLPVKGEVVDADENGGEKVGTHWYKSRTGDVFIYNDDAFDYSYLNKFGALDMRGPFKEFS